MAHETLRSGLTRLIGDVESRMTRQEALLKARPVDESAPEGELYPRCGHAMYRGRMIRDNEHPSYVAAHLRVLRQALPLLRQAALTGDAAEALEFCAEQIFCARTEYCSTSGQDEAGIWLRNELSELGAQGWPLQPSSQKKKNR